MSQAVQQQEQRGTWGRRLGWFVALWSAGVAELAVIAWLLKSVMHAVGMR